MCMLHDQQRSSDQTATPLFNAVKTKLAASVLKSRRGGVRMGLVMVVVGGEEVQGSRLHSRKVKCGDNMTCIHNDLKKQ